MRLTLFLSAAVLGIAGHAFGEYDSSFHREEFWSGEYPRGIAVIEPNTSVPGRKAMDKDLKASIKCDLPYKAVFHVWNTNRAQKSRAHFHSVQMIVKLIANHDFLFEDSASEATVAIKKGDEIEYLIPYAEGLFAVRIRGKRYTADQGLWERVTPRDALPQPDEWLDLKCENGNRAWILINELCRQHGEKEICPRGIYNGPGPGMTGYGKARDLTEKEAKDLNKQ
jgi:hypothetical protein